MKNVLFMFAETLRRYLMMCRTQTGRRMRTSLLREEAPCSPRMTDSVQNQRIQTQRRLQGHSIEA